MINLNHKRLFLHFDDIRTCLNVPLGPSTKDVRQMGRWGVVLKFRIFPDEGRGGVVCESSDVRKFLKKSKFLNFSELFKVKTRNYNRSRFQYESIHI